MLANKISKRAKALQKARNFFAERDVLEVDPPSLSRFASLDLHIDPIEAQTFSGTRFLFTSPEYPMKRMLADGASDIYFLGHVFRDGEKGSKHNPEFTMVEWYRLGQSLEQMIDETLDFCRLFTGNRPLERYTYEEAFAQFAGKQSSELSDDELFLLMATEVEPAFNPEALTLITHFPASQAALSQVEGGFALRFEIFSGGFELANGYLELLDKSEQEKRFDETNKARHHLGKKTLPIDFFFLNSLQKGLPACSGVAVGFDRLMMLEEKSSSLDEVLPFTWDML